ncbi:MAG: PAS-domain containing protein [Pseudomonadota bacterium]
MTNDNRQDAQRLALLQAALDHIDQGFTAFDANLELIGWNKRFFELLDFPETLGVMGTHFSAFMRLNAERGEYGNGDIETMVEDRVRRAREFRPHELERRRPNGEIIAVRGVPLPGGGFVTTYTDVTAERERQAALERAVTERTRELSDSEARLRLITDAVPALIAYIDHDAAYRFANRRYANWFGFSIDTILGQPIEAVIEQPLLGEIEPHIRQALRGAAVSYEYRRTGPDGTTADMRSTLIPDVDEAGYVRGCFVLSLDITEQNKREAALRQAQKMEAIGQLTGGLAHDFNNLLTVILGNLKSLRPRLDTGALRQDFLDPAIHAGERGAELTKRLLAFARERPLDTQPVDVEATITDLSRLLRRSLPSSIEVATTVRGVPPHALVDPGQLENALLNLALNARDAISGPGRIVFGVSEAELTGHEVDPPQLDLGRYIRIEVEDTGCGIDADALSRLFDPFFTTKEFGTGSGLGLSMVYGFVRQSNGAVNIRSTPGQGTIVSLWLPVADLADAQYATTPDVAPRQPAQAAGDLILLVEDDNDVRAVVRQQLTDLGYHVLEAENSDDALHLIETIDEIRYLVSDVVMPGQLDGIALAHSAKTVAPDLKVALISGYAGAAGLDGRESDCPFPVLTKPFSDADLDALVREAV